MFKYRFIDEEGICRLVCENAENITSRKDISSYLPTDHTLIKIGKHGEPLFIPPDYKRRLHRINGIGLSGWKKVIHTLKGLFV